MYLYATQIYSSLIKCLLKSLTHFLKIVLFVFLLLNSRVLYIFWIQILYHHEICKYFPRLCLFILRDFEEQNFLIFFKK